MDKTFSGELEFCSNFYRVNIKYKDKYYTSVEHAYQADKFEDETYREKIRLAETAGKAKRLGKLGKIRDDWDEVKFQVMEDILKIKFTNKYLKEKLLQTKDLYLEEGNYWHDNIWGNCFCPKCKNIIGKNMLGKILMNIREKIKNDK
jgi:ribA/ribD-fused uncharacterized protein